MSDAIKITALMAIQENGDEYVCSVNDQAIYCIIRKSDTAKAAEWQNLLLEHMRGIGRVLKQECSIKARLVTFKRCSVEELSDGVEFEKITKILQETAEGMKEGMKEAMRSAFEGYDI